jgi:uncharacterized coiled-coil protein SlyX
MKESQNDNEEDKKAIKALQEMVESLTEKKLNDATEIDELNKKLSKQENILEDLKSSLATLDETKIENESIKRQLARLTEENDQLLAQ